MNRGPAGVRYISKPPRGKPLTAYWCAWATESILRIARLLGDDRPKPAFGGSSNPPGPLVPVYTRPAVFSEPLTPPIEGQIRVWFTWGTWNGTLPVDDIWFIDIPEDSERYFFAVATLATGSERLEIESWEIVAGEEIDSFESDDFGVDGSLPEEIVVSLGTISDTGVIASASRGGSLYARDYVSNVVSADGATTFTRSIEIIRH